MKENPKIEGLYTTGYQVQCPSPRPRNWEQLMNIATGKNAGSTGSEDAWYKIEHGDWDANGLAYENLPKVSFEHWEKMLLEHKARVERGLVKNLTPNLTYSSFRPGMSIKQLTYGVIHPTSKEEAKELLKIFHDLGLKWCNGNSYLDEDSYNEDSDNIGDDTCYWPTDGTHCDLQYFIDDGARIYRAYEVINAYKKSPIGWTPGCSWRHKDDTCGLSISVHANYAGDEYFVDYGEHGTNWVSIYVINKCFETGVWVEVKDHETKQSIINKQSKTNENAKDKEISIGRDTSNSNPGIAAYLSGDQERITTGQRRKGSAVRG
jgi:hypothetical protein